MTCISVVLPCYNRVDFLAKSVPSVLNQTYKDWELIVVDDGSSDGTATYTSEIKDSRVHYIRQENAGVAAARNAGILASRGEWIALLDSDDYWMPGKLEAQLDFHQQNPDILISQTEEIWIRNGRRVNSMNKHKKRSGWIFEPSLDLCLISPSCVMIHRSIFGAVGMFEPAFTVWED
jgi:glycosyltransferase involved in cell wall biosynthesis